MWLMSRLREVQDALNDRGIFLDGLLIQRLDAFCDAANRLKMAVIVHFVSPPIMVKIRSVHSFSSASITVSGRGGAKT